MAYQAPNLLAPATLAVKMNLIPPPSADPTPAALRGTGFQQQQPPAGSTKTALIQSSRPPSGWVGWSPTSTSSKTGGPGPNPTSSGAPATLQDQLPTLATLSPNVRTALKLVPIGLAVYFFAKGDTGLAAVAGAGAAAAWVVL